MVDITERDFNKEVLECELPVFACFTTEWCHSCFPTCLVAEELVREYEGRVKFFKIDRELSPEVAERYHVIAVPTIILFYNSKEVKRLLGFQDRRSLRKLLNSVTDGNKAAGTVQMPRGSRALR